MRTNSHVRLIAAAALLFAALLAFACGDKNAEATHYHCPMHPTYISDRPGDCPICGMRLVPIEGAADSRQLTTDSAPTQPGRSERDGVPGHAAIQIGPAGLQLAGVKTAPVERASLGRAIRTVGTVVADETRIRHVHTKVSGWVEKLYVNFTGQAVRAGEPILEIYSQELLASQEEFLRARETAARFAGSQLPEVRRGGEDLLRAARRRLELFDVPVSFIAELERTGQPRRTVALLAPVSGYVTAKATFEGHRVEPGMELFTITDLSRVWIEAEFYEYEAAVLTLGETAALTLPYDPAVVLSGRIAYIYPTLDVATRTLRVRFEFPNPRTVLKPGMFANVELTAARSDALVIPDSAVMGTGERQVVFVATAPGRFEPREVKVGVRTEGRAEVLSGVAAGERVVTRANFLLDSESRMRAAFAAATAGPRASSPPLPAHEH
jgi:multidrug efflux pump subunit AcrA (membrane-fusion protein)